MKNAKRTALSGVLSALSVVLLYLGAVVWLFSYVSPLLCSFIIWFLLQTAGKRSALLSYVAVSILALVLTPDKETGLIYAMFFGYYPIIKAPIEKIKLKFLCVLTKFALFNVTMVLAQLALIYVFGIPFDNTLGRWGVVLLLVCANIVFLIYELLFVRLMLLYQSKFEKRIKSFLR